MREILHREAPVEVRVHREDLLGGLAVALLILLATFPVVLPYLLVSHAGVAVRVSYAIALTQIFLLGIWWGRMVGGRSLRIATGLTLLGMVLVLVTILLGG